MSAKRLEQIDEALGIIEKFEKKQSRVAEGLAKQQDVISDTPIGYSFTSTSGTASTISSYTYTSSDVTFLTTSLHNHWVYYDGSNCNIVSTNNSVSMNGINLDEI